MTDPRFTKLANLLITYSCRVKKGDHVLIEVTDVPDEMGMELLRAVREAGGTPLIDLRHSRVTREVLRGTDDNHAAFVRDLELARMKKIQCYIAIRGADNMSENSDVPSNRMSLYSKIIRPVLDWRVNKTRWVVLRWPTPSMAQGAGMSTEAFEKSLLRRLHDGLPQDGQGDDPAQKRMKKADRVHIKSPGTDLKFSIKGIGAKMCEGLLNIPDGEVFSCPVKDSVQRPHPVQHANDLFRHEVRERPPGIQGRQRSSKPRAATPSA
jgi:aminopeptidase